MDGFDRDVRPLPLLRLRPLFGRVDFCIGDAKAPPSPFIFIHGEQDAGPCPEISRSIRPDDHVEGLPGIGNRSFKRLRSGPL